jgi:hypothetical protein
MLVIVAPLAATPALVPLIVLLATSSLYRTPLTANAIVTSDTASFLTLPLPS